MALFSLQYSWKMNITAKANNVCMQIFCKNGSYNLQGFCTGNLQEHLPFLSMKYTWKIQIITNANECLHADLFAEIGAIFVEVFKQAICRNA